MSKQKELFVYICVGKDCLSKPKKHSALCRALSPIASIQKVRCQKICKGPVIGVEVQNNVEWFSKVTSAKHRNFLAIFLQTGKIHRALLKRKNKKRRGKIRL